MRYSNYIYIFIMAAVTYAIRALPLTLIRKPIKNRFLQSFLHYVPYVTLAVMTFPAILTATNCGGLAGSRTAAGGRDLLWSSICAGAFSLLSQFGFAEGNFRTADTNRKGRKFL